jgi:hypothetical protein
LTVTGQAVRLRAPRELPFNLVFAVSLERVCPKLFQTYQPLDFIPDRWHEPPIVPTSEWLARSARPSGPTASTRRRVRRIECGARRIIRSRVQGGEKAIGGAHVATPAAIGWKPRLPSLSIP